LDGIDNTLQLGGTLLNPALPEILTITRERVFFLLCQAIFAMEKDFEKVVQAGADWFVSLTRAGGQTTRSLIPVPSGMSSSPIAESWPITDYAITLKC